MKKKKLFLGLSLLACATFGLASCNLTNGVSGSNTTIPTNVASSTETAPSTNNTEATSGTNTTENNPTTTTNQNPTGTAASSVNPTTNQTQAVPTTTQTQVVPTTTTTNQVTPTTTGQVTPTTTSQVTPTTTGQVTPTASSQVTPTTTGQVTPTASSQVTPTTTTQNIPVHTSTTQYTAPSDTSVINILSFAGDQESLYGEFTGLTSASEYSVYVKESQDSNYTKIDKQLVRLYRATNLDYYRFDAVGIKNGTYSFKIVPVISGSENESKAVSKTGINVVSYDRTGFAFSSLAGKNGSAPGAYNNDGTLKSNAHVIYLTETNKTTVKATVAGTEYTGIANITGAIKTKKTTDPYAIRILGKLNYENTVCDDMSKWYAMGCKEGSNITIEGIGNDATMYGGGVGFNKCQSIEVRNLGFIEWGKGNSDSDAVQFQGSEHVWVHDNDIFYGHKASGDQAKGDGSVDLKDDTKYMTVSYNHFWDSGKMSLCGMKSESGENYISYHHNWFDHSDSRHPRIRTMTVHVYNNYYDGVSKYGIGAVLSSQCFAEGNYFRNCKYPFLIGGYGTDGAASKSTFSGETKGFIKAYNNHIEGAQSLWYANVGANVSGSTAAGTKTNSDAYLASSRDEIISSEYTNGVAYSNFDTTKDLGVTADKIQSPEEARATIMEYAGRVGGGDIQYTFDNSIADTSYEIDENLSAILIAYKSKMVSVQGIDGENTDTPADPVTPTPTDDPSSTDPVNPDPTPVQGSITLTFNGSGAVCENTSFFTVAGSVKKSSDISNTDSIKQTYSYASKLDSKGSITFTLASAAKVKILASTKASDGAIAVGTNVQALSTSPAEYEFNLAAGTYVIKQSKGECYVFYVVIE